MLSRMTEASEEWEHSVCHLYETRPEPAVGIQQPDGLARPRQPLLDEHRRAGIEDALCDCAGLRLVDDDL
jgi:hypothetical protein